MRWIERFSIFEIKNCITQDSLKRAKFELSGSSKFRFNFILLFNNIVFTRHYKISLKCLFFTKNLRVVSNVAICYYPTIKNYFLDLLFYKQKRFSIIADFFVCYVIAHVIYRVTDVVSQSTFFANVSQGRFAKEKCSR